jgi:hypothetical protein
MLGGGPSAPSFGTAGVQSDLDMNRISVSLPKRNLYFFADPEPMLAAVGRERSGVSTWPSNRAFTGTLARTPNVSSALKGNVT